MRPLVVLFATVLVVAGCSTVDSNGISTTAMTADLLVKVPEDANAVDVTAAFRVGTLTYVELDSKEKVTASADGQQETLGRSKFAGTISYTGQLKVAAPRTEITISLQRDDANSSAPSSTVALPEPVHLSAPVGGTKLSRRQTIQVTFASGPAQTLTWTGPCIQTGSLEIEPGRSSTTIAAGLIRAATPASPSPRPVSSTCQIELTLTRHTTGKLDGAFKDGSITAVAQSIHQVVSAP
jgi:hypothetical protein